MMWLLVGCAALAGDPPPPPADPPTMVEQVAEINQNMDDVLARLKEMAADPPPPTEPPTGTVAIVTVDEAPAPAEPPEAAKPTE